MYRYNLLLKNCEHFAQWCKTGCERSQQAESFFRSVGQRITNLSSYLKLGTKFFYQSAATHNVAANEASKSVLPLSKALPLAVVVGNEIQMICRDIKEAQDKRRAGDMSREEFIKFTVKRTSECVGSLTGVAISVVIPVTRNAVGMTVAATIGQSIGGLVGRQLAVAYDQFKTGNK